MPHAPPQYIDLKRDFLIMQAARHKNDMPLSGVIRRRFRCIAIRVIPILCNPILFSG